LHPPAQPSGQGMQSGQVPRANQVTVLLRRELYDQVKDI
jgi:hypothetical protein